MQDEGAQNVSDIMKKLSMSNGSARSILINMKESGLVERVSHGTYNIPESNSDWFYFLFSISFKTSRYMICWSQWRIRVISEIDDWKAFVWATEVNFWKLTVLEFCSCDLIPVCLWCKLFWCIFYLFFHMISFTLCFTLPQISHVFHSSVRPALRFLVFGKHIELYQSIHNGVGVHSDIVFV